jgi:hypothetical protein
MKFGALSSLMQPTQATLLFENTRALSDNQTVVNGIQKSVRVYEVCKGMNNERNVTSN